MSHIVRFISILGLFFTLPAQAIPTQGHQILYSGPSPYAIEAVHEISKDGGNLIDATVAVALTLSVTSPYFAGLGGGGFAMVKMNNDPVEALDFRETAPASANQDYYKGLPTDASITGGRAVGVPGIPAGLYALHKRYGKLPWGQVFGPAMRYAKKGFAVSGDWSKRTKEEKNRFNEAGRQLFFKKSGEAYLPGEVLHQPAMFQALYQLKKQNVKPFYFGEIAHDIVKSVKEAKGTMEISDLNAYKVRWLTPITSNFNGYKIYLMPPPSSGGVVIASALSMIEKLKIKDMELLSLDELHHLAEIEKRAFRGRNLLGDPDFTKNPIALLTSDRYISELLKSLNSKKSVELKPIDDRTFKESNETTHFSIMDSAGNAIAMTITLNGNYGSGVVTSKFGIALNNEMDDFTTKPGEPEPNMYGLVQGQGNSVQGGKRPLSSMSPTLVEKDKKIVMSLGSPGGPRIISGVLQVLYRTLGQDLDIDLAIQTPRIHHQFLPNKLYYEANRLSPEIIKGLKGKTHEVEASWMGKVYAVQRRTDGILEGAYDSRGEGASGGI